MGIVIRFYRRRDADAECYRAVQWPEDETEQDDVIVAVRGLLGKLRPGAAMIVRVDDHAIAICEDTQDIHQHMRRAFWPGVWLVIPQDSRKCFETFEDDGFHATYEDATIKGVTTVGTGGMRQ